MDVLIENYLKIAVNDELMTEIVRSFEILNNFNYQDIDIPYNRILMDSENTTMENVQDSIFCTLHSQLDEVLKAHTLVLKPDTSLWKKNEVLEALYAVQYLIDYANIKYLLESDLEDDEKLYEVISQLSVLTISDCAVIIDDFNPDIILTLNNYINEKEANKVTTTEANNELVRPLLDNLKLFKHYLKDQDDLIGFQYVAAGILVGMPFKNYLSQVKEIIFTDNYYLLALNILSIIYLSSNGYKNPLLCFKNYSGQIFNDLQVISAIDANLNNIVGEYTTYQSSIKSNTNTTTTKVS